MTAEASNLVGVFLRWIWLRAVLHRGWWLVTSVYLVIDADLRPSQLVLIGVAQSVVALVSEVPAGVVADTFSRKWSLVLSQLLMGTAMLATGLTTNFSLIVATQALWGISWCFASGADVAWITDELDDPERISGVLLRSARAQLTGAAVGIVGFGILAAVTNRSVAMMAAGAAMLVLGWYVWSRFGEERFEPATTNRWHVSWSILKDGIQAARGSRIIVVMLAATVLVDGATQTNRLHQRRLVDLGLPADPVLWFTILGLVTLIVGALALRAVEHRIEGVRSARNGYALVCGGAVVALMTLALTPDEVSGSVAIVFVAGIAASLTRTISTILVNREASSEVRATVHSFLAQAEYLGEIICGLLIAVTASLSGSPLAFTFGASLFGVAGMLVRGLAAPRGTRPRGVESPVA